MLKFVDESSRLMNCKTQRITRAWVMSAAFRTNHNFASGDYDPDGKLHAKEGKCTWGHWG